MIMASAACILCAYGARGQEIAALQRRMASGRDAVRVTETADAAAAVRAVDLPGRDNAEAAFRLEQEFGILTRCGLHCAPAAHRSLGTFPQGTIRFSLGFANTEQDVDAAVAALRAISAG